MKDFRVTTDHDELDESLVHDFLSKESYWARGVSFETVQKAMSNSLCFGGFIGDSQIAFARVVSDYSMFAYFRDMFVLKEHRGNGYGRALVRAVISHPELQDLHCFMLGTDDAHGLYRQYGFEDYPRPERLMLLSGGNET